MLEYPKILTDADWQKQKGIVAKMVGETGMGAAMQKCKAVYDTINWMPLTALSTYKNEEALAQAKAAAMQEGKKFETFRTALFALRDHAKKVHDKFKAHKLIPKASSDHVAAIIAACEQTAVAAKSQGGPIMAKFDEAEKRMHAARAVALKVVNDQVAKVRQCLAAVVKKPEAEFYNATCWQPVRAFAAGVAKAPPLAAFQPEWKTLSSITPGQLKDGAPVKAHAEKLTALLNRTAAAAAG
jgi:hypothetical protein